jgi:hypothetical protein
MDVSYKLILGVHAVPTLTAGVHVISTQGENSVRTSICSKFMDFWWTQITLQAGAGFELLSQRRYHQRTPFFLSYETHANARREKLKGLPKLFVTCVFEHV